MPDLGYPEVDRPVRLRSPMYSHGLADIFAVYLVPFKVLSPLLFIGPCVEPLNNAGCRKALTYKCARQGAKQDGLVHISMKNFRPNACPYVRPYARTPN